MALSFSQAHPLSFELRDAKTGDQIMQTGGQDLVLEIQNNAQEVLRFAPVMGEGYHFELRFQPGVITLNALQTVAKSIIKENPGWTVVAAPLKGKQNQDANALYLTNTQAGRVIAFLPEKLIADNPSKLSIKIAQLTIHPELQGPIQILFAYRNIYHTDPKQLLAGTAQHTFDIKHMAGYSHLPMHIGLAGSNTILTNGTPHSLEVHLINAGEQPIAFGTDTKFILRFDFSVTEQSWAIGNGKMPNVKVTLNKMPINPVTEEQFNWVSWELNNTEGNLNSLLAIGEQLVINIAGLSTTYPPGWTNLYVEYKNIPGYQDGQLILPLEKTPVVDRGDKVGIGFDNPQASLAVNGGVHIGGASDPGSGNLYVEGYVGVNKGLHVGSLTDPGNKNLLVDGNIGIGMINKANLLSLGNALGKKLAVYNNSTQESFYGFGISAGTLEFHANSKSNDTPDMVLKANGNVGIGFESLDAKFAVNGGVHIGGTTDPGDNNLQVDGKITVGDKLTANNGLTVMGTSNLQTLNVTGASSTKGLTVNGDLNITGQLKVNGMAAMVYHHYTHNDSINKKGDNVTIKTEFKVSEYVLSIVGFNSGKKEKDWELRGVEILPFGPLGDNAYWYIRGDLKGLVEEYWDIVVLAIRRELVDLKSRYTG